jgi:hypothetical protein
MGRPRVGSARASARQAYSIASRVRASSGCTKYSISRSSSSSSGVGGGPFPDAARRRVLSRLAAVLAHREPRAPGTMMISR